MQREVNQALTVATSDDALAGHFLAVWPVVESILESFSQATGLPIFVYLNESKVFQSSKQTIPPFCSVMLGAPETAGRCYEDGLRRAKLDEPDIDRHKGIQYCHAGMYNGRSQIDTGCVGKLTILFGSKKSVEPVALKRRQKVIEAALNISPELGRSLQDADSKDIEVGEINPKDAELMGAITKIIKQLIDATVGFRSLTINMAHELSLMMVGLGLLTKELKMTVEDIEQTGKTKVALGDLLDTQKHIYNESRLGLYVVRNFLSHASETRYEEVIKPRFERLQLETILREMVEIHELFAATKGVSISVESLSEVPQILGSELEIRRLFHNVLNNAIKYSYYSVPNTQRVVKIRSKVPYNPGFSGQRSFALTFENYGLGLTESEVSRVFNAGFRGQQAMAEVPIGAGIGLAEARKIMKVHGGRIKLRSTPLHEDTAGTPTYLTTVDLIFPYEGAAKHLRGKKRDEH